MSNFFKNIFSIECRGNHKIINFLGIKFKFLNLKKLKYVLYRRYIQTILTILLENPIVSKRNFINFLFTYNKSSKRFIKRIIWRNEILKFFFNKKVSIPVFDFNITTSCTLKCKECGSLMPFYPKEKQYSIDFETFKKDVDKLLLGVDKIHIFKLIGGEPLLVRDLDKMVEYCAKKQKIKNIEIITNGTIVFSQNLLKALKKYRKKAFVVISNYSSNKELTCFKYDKIKDSLAINQVEYLFMSYPWFQRGAIYKRGRDTKEIKEVFKKCWQRNCIALLDGKFHHCTRSIAIQRLSDFKFLQDEYIDIRKSSKKSIIKQLRKFYLKDCFRVCDFCMTPSQKRIPRAQQVEKLMLIGQK